MIMCLFVFNQIPQYNLFSSDAGLADSTTASQMIYGVIRTLEQH